MKQNLLEGSICKGLFIFTVPIFLSLVLQMTYSIVDSIIVGNFVGANAFAAISSTNPLNGFIISFFTGMAQGSGVVIANILGQKNIKKLNHAISTAVILGFFMGIAVTIIGVSTTPTILKMMKTPPSVIIDAVDYTRIFYFGSIFMIMMNFCITIVQCLGDTKTPLIYLLISTILNIVLDLVFIIVFKLGVKGAAYATLISNFVSFALTFRLLNRFDDEYRFDFKNLFFKFDILVDILKNGIPSGLSFTIISLANVVVQSNINKFGEYAMSGIAASSAIESLVFIPISSFSNAITTFVSQNLGAGNEYRAKRASKLGIICSVASAEFIGIVTIIFAPQLVSMFNSDPKVIHYGVDKTYVCGIFYAFLAYTHIVSAVLRGAQKPIIPMMSMIIFWCGIRVAFLSITGEIWHNIFLLYWVYPLTWFLSSIFLTIYIVKKKPLTNWRL